MPVPEIILYSFVIIFAYSLGVLKKKMIVLIFLLGIGLKSLLHVLKGSEADVFFYLNYLMLGLWIICLATMVKNKKNNPQKF